MHMVSMVTADDRAGLEGEGCNLVLSHCWTRDYGEIDHVTSGKLQGLMKEIFRIQNVCSGRRPFVMGNKTNR